MNTLETENNRHAEQLAAKVSRLKNVRKRGELFLSDNLFLFSTFVDCN